MAGLGYVDQRIAVKEVDCDIINRRPAQWTVFADTGAAALTTAVGYSGNLKELGTNNDVRLPAGTVIEQVTIRSVTAPTSGGLATISIGLKDSAGAYQDGVIHAADAIANFPAANQIDSASLVGPLSVGNLDVNVLLKVGTAALTAGRLILTLHCRKP
eukprot:TRINITY_DN831_c0_g2_i13.p2 TRINITY_DN831_c0_g2~~TRINITY_DN831_c0_g2_i13.p2  ORF type:complete len:179 (-),score=73.36 TRINITY_DN831_c0_g2_i13:1621-2094(-)